MQLIYAPYNVYRWCVSKGLLPEKSLLVFGEIENKTIKMQDQDEYDETRIIVDIATDEARQTFQVLAGVAVYNLLASESVASEDIQKVSNERVKLYLEQWLEDTSEVRLESCTAEASDVIHPLVTILQIVNEKKLIDEKTIVMLGGIDETESLAGLQDNTTIKISEGQIIEQMQAVLSRFSCEQQADVLQEFNKRWQIYQERHTGEYITIPNVSNESFIQTYC